MEAKLIQSLMEMSMSFGLMGLMVFYLKKELDKNQNKYEKAREEQQNFMTNVMEESRLREEGYRDTIKNLTVSLEVVGQINETLNEVKEDLKELQKAR